MGVPVAGGGAAESPGGGAGRDAGAGGGRRAYPPARPDGRKLLTATEARYGIDCAREDLELLDRLGGRLIVKGDEEWPFLAFRGFAGVETFSKPQAYAPLALWVIGPSSLAEVSERAAAVVGTRAATTYGEFATADLAAGLAERDVAIVSGGAYGIDGAAHRAALSCDGITVAVFACRCRRVLSVGAFGAAAPGVAARADRQ